MGDVANYYNEMAAQLTSYNKALNDGRGYLRSTLEDFTALNFAYQAARVRVGVATVKNEITAWPGSFTVKVSGFSGRVAGAETRHELTFTLTTSPERIGPGKEGGYAPGYCLKFDQLFVEDGPGGTGAEFKPLEIVQQGIRDFIAQVHFGLDLLDGSQVTTIDDGIKEWKRKQQTLATEFRQPAEKPAWQRTKPLRFNDYRRKLLQEF